MFRPALIVHGGAGRDEPSSADARRRGCQAAIDVGWHVLSRGGTALDAVCEAVAALEDAPVFNAGIGSCLTSAGTVEMDASVMAGDGLRAGAVAAVRAVRNPVRLARAVLDEGRHVLLAGVEADAQAARYGVTACDPQDLVTGDQHQRWQQRQDGPALGTVGAAAVDQAGHVAAATSTGGIFYKLPGRVGDSAIIGAGTYADDTLGAASATGIGEAIIRVVLTKGAVDHLRDGSDPTVAAQFGIRQLAQRVGGSGGIIVVDPLGRFGHACNTPHMTIAYMRPDLSQAMIQP